MTVNNKDFRGDIAGLRALAVALVLLNHFGFPGFGFGFIGVDIFFVVSGYLITRVLYKDYLANNQGADNKASIALGTFYLRRIRRLVPAALVVIASVNIISFFLYNSEYRTDLLLDSKWAILFLVNVSFLRSGSDYFQQTSEPSMLQHYWSLSVEEQFYFIWPLLFLIAASFHRLKIRGRFLRFDRRILIIIGMVTIGSYLFLQHGFKVAPLEAYFSIFSRAWELGVGSFLGILAFHKKKDNYFSRTERYLPLAFAILVCAVAMNRDNWALLMPLPVLATGLFLYFGEGQRLTQDEHLGFLRRFRGFALYIGKISYSLYLVHWPILILARHFGFSEGIFVKIALVPTSILFAHLLWKFVEIPFQNIALPKKYRFEEIAFNYIKLRKLWIGGLAFCMVGSLYIFTYPNVSEKLVYSDAKLEGIANDPAILKYSDYQANLLNPNSESINPEVSLNSQDSRTVDANSLPALLDAQLAMILSAVNQNKLTETAINLFASAKSDISPYENSVCLTKDSKIPPDCSTRNVNANQKEVALIGDSKMGQFAQPLIEYFTSRGWKVTPYTMFGCNVLVPDDRIRKNCISRSNLVLDQISTRNFDLVIGAVYPNSYQDSQIANESLDKIVKNSVKTLWLTQFPRITNPKDCLKADFSYPRSCVQILGNESKSFFAMKSLLLSKSSEKFSVIDTTKWNCIGIECPFASEDIFIIRDGSHLTYSFVKKITPLLFASLDSIAKW